MHTKFILGMVSLFSLVISRTSWAQSCRIQGKVQDSLGTGLSDAAVTLLRANKKTLVKSELSSAEGFFSFKVLQPDTYFLYITVSGSEAHASMPLVVNSGDTILNLAPTLLGNKQKQLQEITVAVALPTIERKADRTIFHPENLISTAGGSAYDIVIKAPGITVDQNNEIKLSGKSGVLVYIDDKQVYLSGADLEQYLRSIPGSQIKQIEIIKNPPARYDAAGNAGIINIVSKKNRLPGLNGFISANYAQGRYARSNNSAGLNFSSAKFSLYSNFGASIFHTYQDLIIYRNYLDADNLLNSSFKQRTYINIGSNNANARLAADYFISHKTTLGISIKGVYSPAEILQNNQGAIKSKADELLNNVLANYNNGNTLLNGSYNFNLRHKLDTLGSELTIDADYVTYNSNLKQRFGNTQTNAGGDIIYEDTQNGTIISLITIAALKSDYSAPLGKETKLDIGAKVSSTGTNNEALYTIKLDGKERVNDLYSNHFSYDEIIGAAYTNLAWSHKKLDVQVGLRFEATQLNAKQFGNSLNPATEFGRNYNSLFPTLFASYRADSAAKHVFTFNYGRRIDRPYYKDLNPFISPLDKFTYYTGNPYLRPSFTNNAGITYSFGNYFTVALSTNYSDNQISETIEINNGIYYSRPGNIGSTFQFVGSLESSQNITKWWTVTAYSEVNFSHYQSQLYTQTLNARGTYWYININNSFNLGKGWYTDFSGEYISNITETQFVIGDFGHLSCGLHKKLLKEKGSLKIAVNDLLHSNITRGTINNLSQTTAGWHSVRDTRIASATFSYRFGKTKFARQRHTSTGSEEEQKRVKT